MISLYAYTEKIYNQLPKISPLNKQSVDILTNIRFKDLINDDKKCIEFIFSILEFPIETVSINRNRASHIIITWLLGIGFNNIFKLNQNDVGFHKLYDSNLWLQTAILHDYGYFCKEISKEFLSLNEITKEFDLLTDSYTDKSLYCLNSMSTHPEYNRYFSFSYDEIKNYYLYSQTIHQTKNKSFGDELSDHGIVGACLAFKKYCKNIKTSKNTIDLSPSDVLTQIEKISCIIAASHNIYKSNDDDSDSIYKSFGLNNLLRESPIRVRRTNYLLLLLSLVDTIECTKRFSKMNNPSHYLIQSTTLNLVDVDLFKDSIEISFDRLFSYITTIRKSKDMSNNLQRHIRALTELGDWTDFCAINTENTNSVIIRLKNDS